MLLFLLTFFKKLVEKNERKSYGVMVARAPIFLVAPQAYAVARAGSGLKSGPGIPPRSILWVCGTQLLEPSSLFPSVCISRTKN